MIALPEKHLLTINVSIKRALITPTKLLELLTTGKVECPVSKAYWRLATLETVCTNTTLVLMMSPALWSRHFTGILSVR